MKLPKFYHKKESLFSKFIRIASHSILFWIAFVFFSVMFVMLIRKNDIKIPQKEVVIKVNVKNKINICLPNQSQDEKQNK